MKNKIILIIILICFLSSFIFGVVVTKNSFVNQTNPFNVTWIEEENKTFYIEVPMYSHADNITITIEGLEIT